MQTYDNFKELTSFSTQYDEQGKKFDGSGKWFYSDAQIQSFIHLMQPQVFKLLKYQGNFKNLISSNYFIERENENKFYYKASEKVPFQFIYESHTKIQEQIMRKYLENPFNPAILVKYDQKELNLEDSQINAENEEIKRTIDLKSVYQNFEKNKHNLLCIGPRKSGCSGILNSLFEVQFEVVQPDSIGLFHDAMQVMFDSKEFPSSFNICDMQGFACVDYVLLEGLLNKMPNCLILIQLTDTDPTYLETIIEKLPEELRKNFASKVFVIFRFMNKNFKAKKALSKAFPGFDKNSQIFDFGATGPLDIITYNTKCANALEEIQKFVKSKDDDLKAIPNSNQHGIYWLIEDGFNDLIQNDKRWSNVSIVGQNLHFRQEHEKMKAIIKGFTNEEDLLRDKVFPFYITELQIIKNKKILEGQQRITNEEKLKIEDKQAELRNQQMQNIHKQQHPFFKQWLKNYLKGQFDICDDLLGQLEANYLPRIKNQRKEVSKLKEESQKVQGLISEFETFQGDLKTNLTDEQKQVHKEYKKKLTDFTEGINKINVTIENKVLDSELFQREAKYYLYKLYLEDSRNKKFYDQLIKMNAQNFENGYPVEIIDGDSSQIFFEPIEELFKWVYNLKQKNNKLLVITIMGPQSSGKSTLLNILFGAKFRVSAGRCTKGLNAMFIRSDFPGIEEILVLDSEGIFSIERNDPMYDRKLVIFCMAVSNLLLINIKGELNSEIEKVLQVAIFALHKIAMANAANRKTEVKFLLRDQVKSTPEDMEQAYETLKKRMRLAAQAAGTILENVIKMPEEAKDIVHMFPSAVSSNRVNNNSQLEQTVSSDLFRNECALFRQKIFQNFSKIGKFGVPNIQKWIEDAGRVWTAINESEDLMMIQDLAEINHQRTLQRKLDDFRNIQFKTAPLAGVQPENFDHPFLAESKDEYPDEKIIWENQTIYAQFNKHIDEILQRPMKERKSKMHDQEYMEKIKETIRDKEEGFSMIYTKEMGPNVQRRAQNGVGNIIDSIWQKAMEKLYQKQSENTLGDKIEELSKFLKSKVIEDKNKGEDLSLVEFEQIIEDKIKQTKKQLEEHFFMSGSQIFKDAKTQLKELKQGLQQQQQKNDQSNDNQQRQQFDLIKPNMIKGNGLKQGVNYNTILDMDDEQYSQKNSKANVKSYEDSLKNYITLNDGVFNNACNDIFWNDFELEKVQKQIDKRMEIQKGRWIQFLSIEEDLQIIKQLKTEYRSLEDEKRKSLRDNVIDQLHTQRVMHIEKLRQPVSKAIDLASESNNLKQDMQQYPDSARNELFRIFNDEFAYMINSQRENHQKFCEDENQLISKVTYDLKEYESLFTRTIFSQIVKQTERNQKLRWDQIEVIITQKRAEAIEYYHKLNKELKAGKDCCDQIMEIIATTCAKSLKLVLIEQFNNYEDNIQIQKVDVQKQALEQFFEANGKTQDSLDLIMLHMKDPLAHEKQIINKKYKDMCDQQVIDLQDKFDSEINVCRTNIQEFFDKLKEMKLIDHSQEYLKRHKQLLNQGLQRRNSIQKQIQHQQELDFLEYIYGTIFLAISNNQMKVQKDKKAVLEQQSIWKDDVTLPSLSTKDGNIFNIQKAQFNKIKFEFKNTDLALLNNFASAVGEINLFLPFLIFDQIGEDNAINKIILKEKQNFIAELQKARGLNKFKDNVEKQALGCTHQCGFCGCRCKEDEHGDTTHNSYFHRPMCFKGSWEDNSEKQGQVEKVLLSDYCSSQKNVKSRWPKNIQNPNDPQSLLQRLKQLKLKTDCLQVFLQWNTSSDLDINVMCGCGIWHGWGTKGSTACICETCGMYRDKDVRCGEDEHDVENQNGRKAIEHVYFNDDKKLLNADGTWKKIGMAVYNYENTTSKTLDGKPYNPFIMAIINKHGFQLYPNKGMNIKHDPAWMFCYGDKEFSEQKIYTFKNEDIEVGSDLNSISFPEYVNENKDKIVNGYKIGLWQFSEAQTNNLKNDAVFINYLRKCEEKWDLVKVQMCQDYESKLLNKLHIDL